MRAAEARPRPGGRSGPRAALPALLLAALVVADVLLPGDSRAELALFDLLEAATAVAAGLACFRVGRRLGRLRALRARRRSWTLLGAACLSWAAGQVVWTWQEVVLGLEAPFPSPAEAGFLGFGVLAVASALLVHRGYGTWRRRLRALADGLVVAGSLFCALWVLALERLLTGSDRVGELALSLAYPLVDLVLLTVLLLSLIRNPSSRTARLLAAGGTAMLLADAGFSYSVSATGYSTGGLSDYGWLAAFALFGAAACARSGDVDGDPLPARTSRAAAVLPYAPLLLAAPLVVQQLWAGEDRVVVVTSAALVALVLGRQALLLAENSTLLEVTERQREELRRMAHVDGLTGLANRGLFGDRLREAAARSAATGVPVTVAFVDVDDFKEVNDTLGHAAGDALLRELGHRLARCVPEGGTAARLGGDEFAVVVADQGVGCETVLGALRGALAEPFAVGEVLLPLTASVGAVSRVVPDGDEQAVDVLLAVADTRMYEAKRAAERTGALD